MLLLSNLVLSNSAFPDFLDAPFTYDPLRRYTANNSEVEGTSFSCLSLPRPGWQVSRREIRSTTSAEDYALYIPRLSPSGRYVASASSIPHDRPDEETRPSS